MKEQSHRAYLLVLWMSEAQICVRLVEVFLARKGSVGYVCRLSECFGSGCGETTTQTTDTYN